MSKEPNPDFTAKLDKILSDPRLRHHYQAVLEAHLTAVREALISELEQWDAAIKAGAAHRSSLEYRIAELKAKESE